MVANLLSSGEVNGASVEQILEDEVTQLGAEKQRLIDEEQDQLSVINQLEREHLSLIVDQNKNQQQQVENKDYFVDADKSIKELDKLENKLDDVETQAEETAVAADKINHKSLEKKLEYLKDIKAADKFLETAEDKKSTMEEKAWDAGGNNPKSEADSQEKIRKYEEHCERMEDAESKLEEYENNYEKVLLKMKDGSTIDVTELYDLADQKLLKSKIVDIKFIPFVEEDDVLEEHDLVKPDAVDVNKPVQELNKLENKLENVEEQAKETDDSLAKIETNVDGYETGGYRGVKNADAIGKMSNKYNGAKFYSSDMSVAKFFGDNIESAKLKLNNPFVVDANQSPYTNIHIIGDGLDENSKKAIEFKIQIDNVYDKLSKLMTLDLDGYWFDKYNPGMGVFQIGNEIGRLRELSEQQSEEEKQQTLDKINQLAKLRDAYSKVVNEYYEFSQDTSHPYGVKTADQLVEYAQNSGYSGLVLNNIDDDDTRRYFTDIVAFNQNQIEYLEKITRDGKNYTTEDLSYLNKLENKLEDVEEQAEETAVAVGKINDHTTGNIVEDEQLKKVEHLRNLYNGVVDAYNNLPDHQYEEPDYYIYDWSKAKEYVDFDYDGEDMLPLSGDVDEDLKSLTEREDKIKKAIQLTYKKAKDIQNAVDKHGGFLGDTQYDQNDVNNINDGLKGLFEMYVANDFDLDNLDVKMTKPFKAMAASVKEDIKLHKQRQEQYNAETKSIIENNHEQIDAFEQMRKVATKAFSDAGTKDETSVFKRFPDIYYDPDFNRYTKLGDGAGFEQLCDAYGIELPNAADVATANINKVNDALEEQIALYTKADKLINDGDLTDYASDDLKHNKQMLAIYAERIEEIQDKISKETDSRILDGLKRDLEDVKVSFIALYDHANDTFNNKFDAPRGIKKELRELRNLLVSEEA